MKTKSKNSIADSTHKMNDKAGALLQGLFTIVIIVIGIACAAVFIRLRKPPEQTEQVVLAPLVETERLEMKNIPMVIEGYGTVTPRVQVDIVPEVAGKVISVHPELKVGGFIRANEKILQIDPRDYELALQQAEAAVADAGVKLDTEQAEAEVARKEWSQLQPGTKPASSLVLREPQIRTAKAALDSAQAQLDTAKLRLERTVLSLPFDALIISENVDVGQYVVTGQSLAKAYGTDAVEIEVPLEDKELAWFDVFGNSVRSSSNDQTTDPPERSQEPTAKQRPTALVKADFAGRDYTWNGKVVRTTGQVDKTSRMVSVVVEVTDPFDSSEGKPPLMPGIFAKVFIQGQVLKGTISIPRDAIREGNKVWVACDGRLYIRTLDIVRADNNFAYVTSGLDDGSEIITSSLDAVVDGMKIRTYDSDRNESEILDGRQAKLDVTGAK